jgi:iron complex transport system substrate-binding protein
VVHTRTSPGDVLGRAERGVLGYPGGRFVVVAIALVASLSVTTCGRDDSRTSRSSGAESAVPRRILSLAPSVTEILFAIGAGGQVVGVDRYSDYPPEARRLPRLGALLDPDLEGMLRLRPDLAILLPSERETARALQAAGVATLTVPHETLADVERATLAIGGRTGHLREATALADSLRALLAGGGEDGSGSARRPTILFVVSREAGQLGSFTAAGAGSYLDELIALAGGTNAIADAPMRYPQVSAETALRLRPDIVIEWTPAETDGDPGSLAAADARRIAEWHGLLDRSGVSPAAVHVVHDDLWLRPGPRVAQALDLLRALLGPSGRTETSSG